MSKPKFERRHYNAVAAIMRDNALENGDLALPTWLRIRDDFALMFSRDNSNFSISRFNAACEDRSTSRFTVTPAGVAELEKESA